MKKKLFLILTFIGMVALFASAQEEANTSYWTLKNVAGINLSQTSLTNWAAGGENSIAWNIYFNGSANYKKGRWSWDNALVTDFGQTYTESAKWNKSLDKLNLNSKVGYELMKHWNAALLLDFLTQFTKGYATAQAKQNGDPHISNFMAPGYLTLSLGADYKPFDGFSVLISPLTGKMTFVTDKALSDIGAFGVKPGENVLAELGASIVANYSTNITQNISLITKLTLFTAYNNNPGNIDVNWDMMLAAKISKYLTANLTTNLIYDDDINSVDKDGNVAGPRVQFREVLGLGISYTF